MRLLSPVLLLCILRLLRHHRAASGTRTRNPQFGRLVFYHLNYNRVCTLGGIRTPDLEIRRLLLCPAELLGYVAPLFWLFWGAVSVFLYVFTNYRVLSLVYRLFRAGC